MRVHFEAVKSWALVAFVFLIPWQAVWFVHFDPSQYLRISLYATDVFALLLLALCRPNIQWPTKTPAWQSPILVAVYFTAASLMVAVFPWVALAKFLLITLFVFVAVALFKSENPSLLRWSIILAGVLESTLALWQFATQQVFASKFLGMSEQFTGVPGVSLIQTQSGLWLRAYGTFPHPNILGGFLALAIVFAVNRYFEAYRLLEIKWSSSQPIGLSIIVSLSSIVVMLFGLLASFSRSAVLALAIASLLYYLFERKKNSSLHYVATKLVVVTLAVLVTWQMLLPGLWFGRIVGAQTQRLEALSVSERIAGYHDAWELFRSNAITGVGLQNYTAAVTYLHPERPLSTVQPVHNVFVLLLVEIGFLGVVILCTVFGKHFLDFLKSLPQQSPFAIAVLSAVVLIALLDHYFWSLHAGLILLLLLPIAFSPAKNKI